MFSNVAVFGLGKYQQSGILELKKKNFYIFGFDENKDPFSKKDVHQFLKVSFSNYKKIELICKKNNIKYLFAFSTDAPLKLIATLNKNLNLRGYKKEYVDLVIDKIKLRKFFTNSMNLMNPNYFHFNNSKKFSKNFFLKLKASFVCKPNIGSGSRGVFMFKNYREFLRLFKINKLHYRSKKILVERFIDGTEYAVEGWIYKNKFVFGCLSKKNRTKPPYLLDTSLVINFEDIKIKRKIENFFRTFIKKSKINNVPIHFEFLINNNDIVPIDIAIRGAGFGVYSSILSKIMNQSTNDILIKLIMNKKIQFNKPNKKIFFLSFLFSKKNGYFKGVKNYHKLISLKSLVELELYKKINSKISSLKNGSNRIGHFVLGGSKKIMDKDIFLSRKLIKAKVGNERI